MQRARPVGTLVIAIAIALAFTGAWPQLAAAQPAGWCTAGAKLDVLWGGTWYAATVRGPAAGGKCQVGYDGWAKTWDEAITSDRAAAAGTRVGKADAPGATAAETQVHPLPAQPVPPGTEPGTPPKRGLYTCTEPSGYPDMTSYFAILDGSTYSTAEKARGHYRFDAKSNMISMDSGPLAGKSYQRIPGTHAFLMQHRAMALSCPFSSRDPLRYPW